MASFTIKRKLQESARTSPSWKLKKTVESESNSNRSKRTKKQLGGAALGASLGSIIGLSGTYGMDRSPKKYMALGALTGGLLSAGLSAGYNKYKKLKSDVAIEELKRRKEY